MTASYQPNIGAIVQAYCKQKRFLGATREGCRGRGRRPRTKQVMMILALVGALLLLWTQPAAAMSTITEFHVSNVGVPQGITAGPDGALWFTEFYDNVAGRITTKGASTLSRLNPLNSATYITNGPDGALWLTLLNDVGGSTTNQIGRLTTSGKLTTFTVPKASYIWDITTGPGGNLYFTDGASRVWRVTTTGHFTALPFTDSTNGYPYQITTGPDGNLWFTDHAGLIVKLPTAAKSTTFNVRRSNGATYDLTAGPDGNLWFTLDCTDSSSKIGRITPAGVITEFSFPSPENNDYLYLSGITKGPAGNLWITYQDLPANAHAI